MLKKKPEGAISFLAISCSHSPFEDREAIQWVCEMIKELKPDKVIHLGDLLESDAASRFPSEVNHDLKDEFVSANETLKQIRLAGESVRDDIEYHILEGNHDFNILDKNRIDKSLRTLCDWTSPRNIPEMGFWKLSARYNYSRKGGCFRVGAVTFAHGYEAGQSGDEFQSYSLGNPYGLFIGGHTHRPTEGKPVQCMRTKGRALPYWYLNTGCLRDLNPHFMTRNRKDQWGQGLVHGWALPIKSPRLSKTWDAECVVFRMFNDIY